jgi:hypothetical protein
MSFTSPLRSQASRVSLQILLAAVLTFSPAALLRAGSEITNSTHSGTIETTAPETADSIFYKIWSIPTIYQNPDNPIIQQFSFIGRFQFDYFNVKADKGDFSFGEIRRFRLGEDAWFFNGHLQILSEVDTALRSPHATSIFYNRFTNLYAKLWLCDAFNVRIGKMEPHFGYDREFSDTYQKFFERSVFDDQIIGGTDYLAGVEVSGKFGHFGYTTAIFSPNVDKEVGNFNGGQAYLGEVSYDFSKPFHVTKALWVLDYLHADGKNPNTNVFVRCRDAAATYFDFTEKRFSLVTQFGYDHQVDHLGDIFEFQFMPSYMLTDKLELTVRYQLAAGTENNSISTLNRQQQTVGTFSGSAYNAAYAGLNYYIYGMKLRLMAGEEYVNLAGGAGPKANYSGWTTWVGFRLFF